MRVRPFYFGKKITGALLIDSAEARFMSGADEKEGQAQADVKPLRSLPDPPGELEILFRAHHERVFRAAHRITGSAADAEDVQIGRASCRERVCQYV